RRSLVTEPLHDVVVDDLRSAHLLALGCGIENLDRACHDNSPRAHVTEFRMERYELLDVLAHCLLRAHLGRDIGKRHHVDAPYLCRRSEEVFRGCLRSIEVPDSVERPRRSILRSPYAL